MQNNGETAKTGHGYAITLCMQTSDIKQKRMEWTVFVFLAVFLAPFLAVVGIGGYGLLIWLPQMFL